jgi:UDP-GlcNAc:undecaprenyl-phosphate GlcNAc-1-phosphate transferase
VPIIDTFWIIVRRVLQKKSPFTPDRGHIHHRLLDLGLSHRNAVLVIYALCGVLAAVSILLSQLQALYAFMAIVLAGGLVLYLASRRAQEALDARSYPEDAEGPTLAEADAHRPGPSR